MREQPSDNPKIKLSADKSPSTIDDEVIRTALGLDRLVSEEEAKSDPTCIDFLLKTATTLRLEFRLILKVENLQGLLSLRRLFLDNNLIERICGIDHLVHLEWLDLSFNRIRKIEGLNTLKKLEVLSLYANEIESIEGLDGLTELRVLRLGRNKIANRKDVIRLRRLPALRTLSLKENPFCSSDYEGFVLTMLPDLCYLECHRVDEARREAAAGRHQGDMFRIKMDEEQEAEERKRREKEEEDRRRRKEAFVDTLQGKTLFANLIGANSGGERALRDCLSRHHRDDVLWKQLQHEMEAIGDEIYLLGLSELAKREREVRTFEECIRVAQRTSQEKGIEEIESFMAEKEVIFESVFEMAGDFEDKEAEEISEVQRDEVDRLTQKFVARTKEAYSKLMGMELVLVTQTEQSTLSAMLTRFMDKVKSLFVKARAVDTRYFRKLSELGEKIEEKTYEMRQDSKQAEETTDPLNAERISALISECHDAHQELLLAEESRLNAAVSFWKEDLIRRFRKRERKRDRNRVHELNHFVDSMRLEEEELDVLPSAVIGRDGAEIIID